MVPSFCRDHAKARLLTFFATTRLINSITFNCGWSILLGIKTTDNRVHNAPGALLWRRRLSQKPNFELAMYVYPITNRIIAFDASPFNGKKLEVFVRPANLYLVLPGCFSHLAWNMLIEDGEEEAATAVLVLLTFEANVTSEKEEKP